MPAPVRTMRRVVKWVAVLLLVSLPIAFSQWYSSYSSPPQSLTIASGPEGGQYHTVAMELGRELTHRYGVVVEHLATDGSGENALKVSRGEADFALYQSGTAALEQDLHGLVLSDLNSIGGLYWEVVHLLKHPDHAETPLADIPEARIAVGPLHSGSELIAGYLLEQFELDDDVKKIDLPLSELAAAFRDDEIDAAMITIGIQATVLRDLLQPNDAGEPVCVLESIPFAAAIADQSSFLESYSVPAGMYSPAGSGVPQEQIQTLATRAQIISSRDAPAGLTEMITTIINDPEFQRNAHLTELFRGGTTFAQDNLDFPLHPGAQHFYDPHLKPLLNPDFVEATEGIRSFVVSLAIALFFIVKWILDYRSRSQEHKLDRYIKRLLEIEQEQKYLDQTDKSDDRRRLQDLLDNVTDLRQQALREFTAHEINSDQAVSCFVAMCHALSEKINAKISRQRIDTRLKEMRALIDGQIAERS